MLALLYRRQFAGPSSSRSLKAAAGQRRRQHRAGPWRSRASGPGRRRDSARTADRGCRDWSRHRLQTCARLPPAWPVLAGLDHRKFGRGFVFKSENFSLLMKPATRRQRRQYRAVPGGDRQQVVPLPRQSGRAVPLVMAFGYRDLVDLSRGRPPVIGLPISSATSLARSSIHFSSLFGIPFFSSPFRKGFNSG